MSATPSRRTFALGFIAGAALAAGIALLANAGAWPFGSSSPDAADEVRQVIEDNYYRPVDQKALDEASINGILQDFKKRFGDKFSHYFNAKTYAAFQSATSGEFQGIGLTVAGVKQGLRVVRVIPHAPAERAGIQRGDVIVSAAGHPLAGLSADAGAALIKGEPGTPVDLKIDPEGGGKIEALTVNRARVRLPAAHGTLRHVDGQPVGYVRYLTFSSGAHGELEKAIHGLDDRGAKGFVLDLRGNGGGLLNEAVLSASLFLDSGQLVVSTKSRVQGSRKYDAVGHPLPAKPLVVLIDHETASAAEILTAALADHGIATVVGTRSYGKGVFQDVLPLDSGGALDLTVGRYFTPDGTSLAGKGIQPDVRAKDDLHTQPDEGLAQALAVLGKSIGSRSK
ncbi:MAG: S41 family peptidase [Solirubrobacterales bacterium]